MVTVLDKTRRRAGSRSFLHGKEFGIAAFEVKDDQPAGDVKDSCDHQEAVDSQKKGLQEGFVAGGIQREKQVEDGLSKKDEHNGDPEYSSVKIGFNIPEFEGAHREDRVLAVL